MSYLDRRGLWRNRAQSDIKGFIYFLRSGDYVKIGFSTRDPQTRVRELQGGNPDDIELWAYFSGYMSEEQALHRVFSPLLKHREWFACERKLLDLIWYIESPDHQRFFDRQILENAMHDCVLTGMPHSEIDDAALNASAFPEEWFQRYAS